MDPSGPNASPATWVMSTSWQSLSFLHGTHTPQLLPTIFTCAQACIGYGTFESLITLRPVASRMALPMLNFTPMLAQSMSVEQVLVASFAGGGRTITPFPKSEHPVAGVLQVPVPPLIGSWHVVAPPPQPAQSASLAQVSFRG